MKTGPNPKFFGILFCAALIFGLGLNALAMIRVRAESASIENCKKTLASAHMLPTILQQSQADLEKTRGELKNLEDGLPNAAYVPTMLKQLEALGKTSGIQVIEVRPTIVAEGVKKAKEKETSKNPYDTLDIEVKGTGYYGDAMRFVRALDTFPKVVSARSVTLEPQPNPGKIKIERPILTLSVQLRAYLFKADSAIPPTASAVSTHV